MPETGGVERAGLLCPNCFSDLGLKIMAEEMANMKSATIGVCPNCQSSEVPLLIRNELLYLVRTFFLQGSFARGSYGGAPKVDFNDSPPGPLKFTGTLGKDADLLESTLGIGFCHKIPRPWMFGQIKPLEALCDEQNRGPVIARIIDEYPTFELQPGDRFYRVRKAPSAPANPTEYDSPPSIHAGEGRLETRECPILYASHELDVCVHECRFVADDDLYAATLTPIRKLTLLDLSVILEEKCRSEESLDLAVHMLFLSGKHSYPISRALSVEARRRGFDGLRFPSYFSMLRNGFIPFESALNMSLRKFTDAHDYELSKLSHNLALFGHPIAAGDVQVIGINRLCIHTVAYKFTFGPADYIL